MSWGTIWAILKFLPELWELVKEIRSGIESGLEEWKVRKAIKGVSRAFKIKDAQESARALDDLFRK